MFTEPKYHVSKSKGWIEVICGSMFSGKTEELIRRLNRARIAKQKVEIFKAAVDTQCQLHSINSRSILFAYFIDER
jgi:thymidine kinase